MLKIFPQLIPQETCLSCDGCCRFQSRDSFWRPKLGQEEIKQNIDGRNCFGAENIDGSGSIKAVEFLEGFRCFFLVFQDNKCCIYEQRPFECRLYPLLLRKKGNDLILAVHLSCPFVQENLESPLFARFIDTVKHYLDQGEGFDFLKENLNVAGNYSSCEDEVKDICVLAL